MPRTGPGLGCFNMADALMQKSLVLRLASVSLALARIQLANGRVLGFGGFECRPRLRYTDARLNSLKGVLHRLRRGAQRPALGRLRRRRGRAMGALSHFPTKETINASHGTGLVVTY
jgi:hypothetical protein